MPVNRTSYRSALSSGLFLLDQSRMIFRNTMNSNFFVFVFLQLSGFFSFMLNNITHLNGNGPGKLFHMALFALNVLRKWEHKLYYIATKYVILQVFFHRTCLFYSLYYLASVFFPKKYIYTNSSFFAKYTQVILIVLLLVQVRKPIAHTLLLSNCCECGGLSVTDTAAAVCVLAHSSN